MQHIPANVNETDAVDPAVTAVHFQAEVDTLRRRLAALEEDRPRSHSEGSRSIRNVLALVISIAVLTVLANAPIVHGQSVVDALIIDTNGYVGIGGNPDRPLTVQGVGPVFQNIKNGVHELFMGVDDSGGVISVSNHDLIFRSGDDENMRITADGDVGIGTDEIHTKLHVSGDRIRLQNDEKMLDLRADGAAVDILTETNDLYISTRGTNSLLLNPRAEYGRVGIGTEDPKAKLDVGGNFRLNGQVPIQIERVRMSGSDRIGDDVKRYQFRKNIKMSAAQWHCVASGFWLEADTWEDAAGPYRVRTLAEPAHRGGRQWSVEVYWPNEGGERPFPTVDIVCFNRSFAKWTGLTN